MQHTPKVDLHAIAMELGVDLNVALALLRDFYTDIDARNLRNTGNLDLPCHRGCDACCHESVFLTPLEFFAVWQDIQTNCSDITRDGIVQNGLQLYATYRTEIEALQQPIPPKATDHWDIACGIRFTCPLLDEEGQCTVYQSRELYARLFGSSFNDEGGIYGCHLVGKHLGDTSVTLLRAKAAAQLLNELPLTFMRQVYPFYIHMLYG